MAGRADPREGDRDHFATAHLSDDLRGRSVRGGATTVSAQAARFVLQLGSTVVLARLLTPADFGLVAMVTALTGLIVLMKDFGLSMATVQRERITHAQVSTLFWVNVAVSLALAATFAALAPLVSRFYDEPRLTLVTVAIAVGVALGGLATQHNALLRRQLRLTATAVAEVASVAVGVAVAIALAALGASYWALVAMHVTTPAALAAMVWALSGWRPGLPRRGAGVRGLLRFGGNVALANLLRYAVRHIDAVLIGWWWGAAPVGHYQRAYALLLLPVHQLNTPLTKVGVPVLSRLQDDPERFARYYHLGLRVTAFLGMPVVAFAFVASDELVLLALGEQWGRAAGIFRYLAPAAFVSTVDVATTWVYLALGLTGRQLRWTLLVSVVTIAVIAACLPLGPEAVAIGFSVVMVTLKPAGIAYCLRPTPLTATGVARSLTMPLLAALMAGAATWLVAEHLPTEALASRLGTLALTYAVAYLIPMVALRSGRELLGAMVALRADLRRGTP